MPVRGLVFAALGLSCLTLDALGMLGPVGPYALFLVSASTLVMIATGVRRYRPAPSWPWYAMCTALALFLVGGGLATAYGTLGNLTVHRSIVPDMITLPGYALLAAWLLGLSRAKSRGEGRNIGVVLDAFMVALAILACAWVYVIDPVLARHQTPLDIRLILTCYPAASLFIVVMTLRIAFGREQRRSPSYWFLLGAVSAMFVGDSLYMLAEIHLLRLAPGLMDLPYGLAYLTAGLMATHPSMRSLSEHAGRSRESRRNGRIVIVVAALLVPAVLSLSPHDEPVADRTVLFAIIVALTGMAVARMAQALHESERSESKLEFAAMHDSLTGLPNRRLMRVQLSEVLDRTLLASAEITVLYLDLDHFKLVNDTLGHTVGDELLCRVARRLGESVGRDDLVTRIGGDEFLVVMEQVAGGNRALEVAERIRGCLRVPFMVNGREFHLSASIGLASSHGRGAGACAEDLVRDADLAMYQAKDGGRDAVVVFEASMGTRLAERVTIERELRHAVERDELHLVYQPLVMLPKGPVKGVEALLRWEHPTLGAITPATFIPLAEQSGMIVEIGGWVLDEAVRQVAAWRLATPEMAALSIAVNLSALQLRDEGLCERVATVLARHGVAGDALVLEVTESVLMADAESSQETLRNLKALGVRLAIDDFGTEYSSLAYLKRFPFDILKIDRSFVASLGEEDNADETLIAAIVAMAKGLGITTVAEGVETSVQAARVIELGCDVVQGYLYSRPVQGERVVDVVASLSGWAELVITGSL